MTERDELADVIADFQACGSCAGPERCGACLEEADAILAAGYRKSSAPDALEATKDALRIALRTAADFRARAERAERELEQAVATYAQAEENLRRPQEPRTVTTAAELDALPMGSVVLDDLLVTYSKPYNAGNFWLMVGDEERHPAEHVFLPATVLHEGGAA